MERSIWLSPSLSFSNIPLIALFLAITTFVFWNIRSYWRLRHIPGPWLAAWTNFPRLFWVRSNRAHDIHIALHEKYGPLVRFGPNMVSVQDPSEIANIYSMSRKFEKSDFYHVLLFHAKGKPVPTIFATQDEELHRLLKRPIASIYSMSNLVSFESYVDTTMTVLLQEFDCRFVATQEVCDLGKWLQMFAFDVMGEITFSKRLGFLESGDDVSGLMDQIWQYFKKSAPITQMPWVDNLWAKNPIFQKLYAVKPNGIVAFALARAKERQEANKETSNDSEKSDLNNRDFLSRFLAALDKDKTIPPSALTAWTTSNIAAGSDTTAIMLRTIFYNLLKYPTTMQKLLDELRTTIDKPANEYVTWKETRDLPYLDACIKEAGRMHPPFALPLERVVPKEGAIISGQKFEPGTVVGMSIWVAHRHVETFGEDCGVWRPERWLCDEVQRRKMENAMLTFGAGHRVCLGKNISYLELYKLVPTLLRIYEFEFSDLGCSEWKVENRWFANQTGLNVRIKRRSQLVSIQTI